MFSLFSFYLSWPFSFLRQANLFNSIDPLKKLFRAFCVILKKVMLYRNHAELKSMINKRYITLALLLLALVLAGSGCGAAAGAGLTFSQLTSQADKYNGRTVTFEAFYFSGFEISALAESLGPASTGPWRIVPSGDLIWVKGGITQELLDRLYTQSITPSGYQERFGKLKVTGNFETGQGYGHLDAYRHQIKITDAELLDWTPPPSAGLSPTASPSASYPAWGFDLEAAQTAAREIAEDFIRNSSTFKFDGIEGSLKLIKDEPGYTSAYRSWSYTFEFQTLHPGHGDRTGKILAQVITRHTASILVKLENNIIVISAVCDDAWNMLDEKELPVTVKGVVTDGGDTAQPGDPLDVPRKFVYQVMKDEGFPINVSYTAYPPSPAGDAARSKIILDFYSGEVRVGDRIEARGMLDQQSNTVVVAEEGDYIRTFPRQAVVLGIVIGIQKFAPAGSPSQTVYELLRDDGTRVNVSFSGNKEVALSLYNESIRTGDYMKAAGNYDPRTNTVDAAGQGDMIKTYDHNPVLTPAVWE